MSSEVAQFREQQQLEEESARLGLSGLATVASHAMIVGTRKDTDEVARLFQEGRDDEAYALWESL